MEEKVLKLMAQLSLVAIVAWVVAAAVGKAAPSKTAKQGCKTLPWSQRRDLHAGGDIWNHTPVQAPRAEDDLAFGAAPIFG